MKKKVLAYTCSSNDLMKDFLLYENFWSEVNKKFKKFYFINLINLIDQRKLNTNKKHIEKKFPKNLIIFTPKTYAELEIFLSKNEIITFISLGRDLKYFRLLYILKKYKCKILINLYIGYTGQNNNFFIEKHNLFTNFYYYLKFIIFKKIIWIFFRFFVLINIFPRIEILFEGSKKNINIYKNYLSNVIKKKIPLINISYIKEIIHVNFRSYETLKNQIPKLESKYIVFLDSGFDHGDAIVSQGPRDEESRKKYYNYLEKFLLRISALYEGEIIICLHPKTDEKIVRRYIKKMKIIKNKSSYFITKAKVVLFHDSSIILDAIFLKKKIINLTSPLMGKYYEQSNKKYKKFIKIPSINIEKYKTIKKKEIDRYFLNKRNLYNNYLKNFLTFKVNEIQNIITESKKFPDKFEYMNGSNQIITIIKRRFFHSN